MKNINVNDYCFGSFGSLIMDCPKCKRIHFKNALSVLNNNHKEFCVHCNSIELIARKKEIK